MPLPKRGEKEERSEFMSRCMSDEKTKKEFSDSQQRVAYCLGNAGYSPLEAADYIYGYDTFGFTEEVDENNFYIPSEAEYEDVGEETEEWDVAEAKPGLWENIRKKKQREGKNYKPAQPGDPDRPTPEQIKRAQSDDKDAIEAQSDFVQNSNLRSQIETSEAVKYGRPSQNDPRKTPAPKKDQKRGSKKNKPKSAKDDKGKITFSEKTISKLKKKVSEHNAKGKGSKATLGMLKAVYRRGAGAYSTSHAPKMSRDGWAMARVNAFLYLLRNGRPSNPNYKQDNDLLPKGHKRSSKAEMTPEQKKALDKNKDGKITKEDFELLRKKKGEKSKSAEYQGRKVTLNKPFRTPDGPKKFSVYVKNDKGNVVKVNFGDPNMEIKRDNPARRKSFRARHKCDTDPGPKWKARYWSCKKW